MITKNQIRILSALFYLSKEKKQRVVLSTHISKLMPDMRQGTLSAALNLLEHKLGLVISLPCDCATRFMYASKNAPSTTRKYYITGHGNKLVNMYLKMVKRDDNTVDYEKLSAAAYATIRTAERRLTQGF